MNDALLLNRIDYDSIGISSYNKRLFDFFSTWSFRFLILMTFTTIIYFQILNLIVFGIAMIMCVLSLCFGRIKYVSLFLILISVCSVIITTVNSSIFNTMPLYYIFWIIYSSFIISNRDVLSQYFNKDKKFVIASIIIWALLVFAFMFLPMCYVTNSDGRGFVAFTGAEDASGGNRLCPVALTMLILLTIAINQYKNRKLIICSIPMLYSLFMGGSRTYFTISMAVVVILLFAFCKNIREFIILLIIFSILGVFLISITMIGTRIEGNTWTESSYGDFWYVLTSGRSVFWVKMLDAFFIGDKFNHYIGYSFTFTVETGGHWGHNDFVELLCEYGYIGVVTYLISIIALLYTLWAKKKTPLLVITIVIFVWLFNAFFNMFYTYVTAAFSFPWLVWITSEIDWKKQGGLYGTKETV